MAAQAIYFILRRLPPYGGGAEKQAVSLARALGDQGAEVKVISGRIGGECETDLAQMLPDSSIRFWGTVRFHLSLLWYLEKNREAAGCLYLLFLNNTTLIAALWACLRGKRFVYKLSGSGQIGDLGQVRQRFFSRLVWRFVQQHAFRIIALSLEVYREAVELIDRDNVVVQIPGGVDLSGYAPSSDSRLESVDSSNLKFLCVGRLAKEKQFEHAIRAISEIPDAELRIAGEGPERERLTRVIHELEVGGRIRLEGYCNDTIACYQWADAVIVASSSEGLCNVMLEAMACGTPVISTPVSGVEETITSGENGIVADSVSLDSLKLAVTQFASLSAPDRAKMGKAARERVEAVFSIEKIAAENRRLF